MALGATGFRHTGPVAPVTTAGQLSGTIPDNRSFSKFQGVLSILEDPYERDVCVDAEGEKGENFFTSEGISNPLDLALGVPDAPAACLAKVFTGVIFRGTDVFGVLDLCSSDIRSSLVCAMEITNVGWWRSASTGSYC
jgi:hypothetical protein